MYIIKIDSLPLGLQSIDIVPARVSVASMAHEDGLNKLLVTIASGVGSLPGAVATYPLTRVISIRQAQGALPGLTYSNVLTTLRQMPTQQGGIAQVWRGVMPLLGVKVLAAPLMLVVAGQLRYTLRPGPRVSATEKLWRNIAMSGSAGVLVNLVTHPLAMASLRLRLDLGGGTLGKRTFTAGRGGTAAVVTAIVNRAGVISWPFALEGGLYRGVLGSALAALVRRGAQFGIYDTVRSDSLGFAQKFALGLATTSFSDWLVYPITVGVVRAQAAVAPIATLNGASSSAAEYRGALDAMIKVARAEGIAALWRGFGLKLATSLGGAALLVTYDFVTS